MKMIIAIGSDHGGFALKEKVKGFLTKLGHEVNDMGTDSLSSCDYPVYAKAVAYEVADKEADMGIVICTTGIGVSITANKIKGIRAALCTNTVMAELTRLHNDSNVLALGAGITGDLMALDIVDVFINTKFSGEERHARRVSQIED